MRVRVLGPISVDDDATALSPRDRVVLTALAVTDNGAISSDRLAEALWGADRPTSAPKVVQGCIVRLRKALGSRAIETVPDGYRLVLPSDEVDVRRFERLADRGDELLALDQPERAAHVLTEALALWRGSPLDHVADWDAGRAEIERLTELHHDAEELRLDALLRAGRHREVLGPAQKLVADVPLRERRWALLARAQYQAGRQSDALTTLHRARVLLSTELGLDPGPELVALQDQILRHDADLAAAAEPSDASAQCPYLGLVPYGVDDADRYFGRTGDVAACLRRLTERGVLVVVGPSGSGKSSLVRAGVVAALRHDDHDVVVITPGTNPRDALTAVPTSGRAPVLVVDQAEEAVVAGDHPDQRDAFLSALVAHAARGPLVLALRADAIGEMTVDTELSRLVERGLYLLGAMSERDLRAAITGPARQAGLLVEPGLVDLLVREVEDEPGALPLLSHALRATWERREGRTLTVAAYTAGGGIRGAVAQSAEAIYGGLEDAEQLVLRDLLLRLVGRTPAGVPVRARLTWRAITADDQHAALVDRLVAARLLTSDGDGVELAHEALTRAWPRLRAWLEDDEHGQRILRHLSLTADTWEQMGRPSSELYRGMRLTEAVRWRDESAPHLTPVERAFLEAGVALADAEQREAEQRALRQTRTNRRLRALLAGVGALALAAIVAGIVANLQSRRADAAAVAADARRVGAQALAADDIDLALLLAVEGVRLDDSADTRANLLQVLGRSPQLVGVVRGEGTGTFGEVSVSPDGRTVAVADDRHRLTFANVADGSVRGVFDSADARGRASAVTGRAAFHPQGGPIAVGLSSTEQAAVRLLDPVTLEELPEQLGGVDGPRVLPWALAYSPEGSRLAVAIDRFPNFTTFVADDTVVVIWDTAAWGEPEAVLEVPDLTHGLAFGPDGRELYTATHHAPPQFDAEPAVTVYDTDSGEVMRTLDVPGHPFALGPDGRRIAGVQPGATGGQIVVSDARTGSEVLRLRGHDDDVLDVAFSPDGERIAASSAEGAVLVWDATTGTRLHELRGHAGAATSVAFAPDGGSVHTAGADHALLRWDLGGRSRFVRTVADGQLGAPATTLGIHEPVILVAPSGDAVLYLWPTFEGTTDVGSRLRVLDLGTDALGPVIDPGNGPFTNAAWHPDGRRFATSGMAPFVRVWDRQTAAPVRDHAAGPGGDFAVAFVAGGRQLLLAKPGSILQRVDAATLEPVGALLEVGGLVPKLSAGPDGRTVAVLTDDGPPWLLPNVFYPQDRLVLVDATAGQVTREVALGFDAEWAAFSPDGGRIAVAGRGGQVALVDVASGELVRPPVVGHDGTVVSVAYSSDGQVVASGGADGQVGLWDGATGTPIGAIPVVGGNDGGVYVGFEPDGRSVLAATWDGVVRSIDTRPDRWVVAACGIAGRDLTRAEWREVFGERPYRRTCAL